VSYHSSIIEAISCFIKIDLKQLFPHPENSEWFYIISVIIFEIKIVAEET